MSEERQKMGAMLLNAEDEAQAAIKHASYALEKVSEIRRKMRDTQAEAASQQGDDGDRA